jgi:hypothetical protein
MFHPSTPSIVLPPAALAAGFVIKYNASGVPLWSTTIDGTSGDQCFGICTDASGNAYVVGQYISTNVVVPLTNGKTLPFTVQSAAFVIKYDTNGLAQWANSMDSSNAEAGYGVAIDASGNVYVTGFYNDPITLNNNITLQSPSGIGGFIIKYNTNGLAQWAIPMDGTNTQRCYGIATDMSGNTYVTGIYQANAVALNNGKTLPTPIGSNTTATFVIKYDIYGMAQWAVKIDGTGSDQGFGIATDSVGNVYVCGEYISTSDVTLGPGVILKAMSGATTAAFIVKYNTAGNVQWATQIDGSARALRMVAD